MKITVKSEFAKAFGESQRGKFSLLNDWIQGRTGRYGEDTITINTAEARDFSPSLTPAMLEDLIYDYAKSVKNQAVMMFIGSIRLALKDVKRAKPGSLPALQAALVAYLQEDLIDGWVYKKYDEKFLPFVVHKIQLHLATPREKQDGAKDYLILSYTANSTAGTARYSGGRSNDDTQYDYERWEWGNFNKKTVPELLAEKGLFHESPELKTDYLRQLALYHEHRPRFGEQYTAAANSAEYEFDPEENSGWGRPKSTQITVGAKYINDDKSVKRNEMAEERDNSWWVSEYEVAEDKFRALPVHPYLRMFNLTTHKFTFKHVDTIQLYKYDPSLKDKIVLPESHRDLIDVLVGDLDAVAGDVVAGKGGGTSILCQGAPGLGKTLTAEIYSEVKELPLYRVHSGQLGTDPQKVEKALQTIFERAQKWGCILLLDEADVYIRRRGDDLDHNAVVACFLRTMEYFSGIFFMTTNRGPTADSPKGDVDDAIASRCVAIITYETPKADDLKRIFMIHSENFGSGLSETDIDLLVKYYVGKIGGRDVKMLLELATRYAAKKSKKVDSETVRMLAQFKGF